MYTYTLTGATYPDCFHAPLEHHTFETEMNGIRSNITVQIDDANKATCIVKTDVIWEPHDLLQHAELLVQNTLNSIAFVSGITTEVFFNRIACPENNVDITLEANYQSAIDSGVPTDLLPISFTIIKLCSSEHGWHLTRSLNEYRLALRHSLDGGFYCYRSIECLRIYCREKFNLPKERDQWDKLRSIAGVERSEIDKIKVFADPNRHGDFQGISGEDRVKTLHSTRNIIDSFFRATFNGS